MKNTIRKGFKRGIALLLNLCIITSLLSSSFVFASTPLSGVMVDYDFGTKGNVPASAAKGNVNINHNTMGFHFSLPTTNSWVAIDLNVDTPGDYQATLLCHQYTSTGITQVYFAPASLFAEVGDDPLSVLTDEYKLGELDCYAPVDVFDVPYSLPNISIPEAGAYKLIFRGTGQRNPKAWSYYMFANELILDGVDLASVTIHLSKDTLILGQEATFSVDAIKENNKKVDLSQATVEYSNSHPEVASFDPASGNVLAISEGTTDISVNVCIGGVTKSDTKTIIVTNPVLQSVTIDTLRDILRVGETCDVTLSVVSDRGNESLTDLQIAYTCSNPEIVQVHPDTGFITAKSPGDAMISVSVTYYGVTKTAEKSIRIVPEGALEELIFISLGLSKDALKIGSQANIIVSGETSFYPKIDLPDATITYESSNHDVAVVDDNGVITGTGVGSCDILVSVTLNGVTLNSSISITVGELSGTDLLYNFTLSASAPEQTTYNMTGGMWAYGTQSPGWTLASGDLVKYAYGIQFKLTTAGRWVALKINVPDAGRYIATLEHGGYWSGKNSEMYLIPASVSNIQESLLPEYSLGQVQHHVYPAIDYNYSKLNDVFIEKTGEYYLVFQAKENNGYVYPIALHLEGVIKLDSVVFHIDNPNLEYGSQTATNLKAFLTDGNAVSTTACAVTYTTSNELVASVSSDGIIHAHSEGTAQITANVTFNNITISATQTVYVTDSSELLAVTLQAPEYIYVRGKGTLTQIASMASGNQILVPSSLVEYTVVSAEPEDVIAISEEGIITGIKAGVATIEAKVQFKGKTLNTNQVTVEVTASSKTRPTIWTMEERENARENIAKYSWAAAECKRYTDEADLYVENIDQIYDMVVAEGLPRYYFVGASLDPERFNCRYCKTNIAAKYGLYSWEIDALNDPWKITCPECKNRFPSNDFGSFYKLGLDEQGVFNIELARQKNNELIAKGESGYLVNILYPDKGADWGVDDGFGYFPGNTYPNGVVERHNYIAYYLHEGLWHGGLIDGAVRSLSYAYVYTGEAKYGRAGAILLDRIADFYPDFNWYQWRTFRGDGYKGKVLDIVWENGFAQTLARAYDAFFPIYGDPEVIEYLSAKSELYGQENPKDSAMAIRKNVEEGILYEIFNASKDGRIAGNFGMTQLSVATAAVALDCMPETGEWLDWIMEPIPNEAPRPAGNVNLLQKLVNIVDRDGMGNEASPSYNSLWLTEILGVAELLKGYETYPGVDLYKNPKFVNMFTSQLPLIMAGYYTMQIGDSGGTASTGYTFAKDTALTGFKRLGDPRLAQFAYMRNGNTVEGLHDEITVKDPEKIQSYILSVIDQIGGLNIESDMMTGYGFAALRDGAKYSNGVNTQRDFSVYFGIGNSHGHQDALNLGIDAFGLNMAPDLGYPEDTGTQPNRVQWVSKPLSHNTAMVDGKAQNALTTAGTPHHFDVSERVKVIDVDANKAYLQTQEYRRTVVMVEAGDDISYGVDFFRILGGDDHVYSFHSQSDEIFETQGLNLVPQTDALGNYIGTYASPDVPWGKDPNTVDTSWSVDMLKYPPGATWLDCVRRDSSPSESFAVDFKVKDFRNVLPQQDQNLHLRMTMLNDFALDEVAIAHGTPPQINTQYVPYLEYVLARRTGKDLDSLFTTVFEPYNESRTIDFGMESVPVEVISGTQKPGDAVKAVRIPLKSGRVDYIVYATNNSVLYRVDGLFDFRGFVGVYSVKDGKPVYLYVNDGDIIGESTGNLAACTGTVAGFTRQLQLDNEITINVEQQLIGQDVSRLVGQTIYVQNDGVRNAAYKIEGIKSQDGNLVTLDIGNVTFIRQYIDSTDFTKGYVYDIAEGATFVIPLSTERFMGIDILRELLSKYVRLDQVTGPMIPQLENRIEQAKHQYEKGFVIQGIKHLTDFLNSLNNDALKEHVSDEAQVKLNRFTNDIINTWQERIDNG